MPRTVVDPVLRILYTCRYPDIKFRGTKVHTKHGGFIPDYASIRSISHYVGQESWIEVPKPLRLAALEKYTKFFMDVPGGRLYDGLSDGGRPRYDNTYIWFGVDHSIDLCLPVRQIVGVELLGRKPSHAQQ